jgi:hypothetical protein
MFLITMVLSILSVKAATFTVTKTTNSNDGVCNTVSIAPLIGDGVMYLLDNSGYMSAVQ